MTMRCMSGSLRVRIDRRVQLVKRDAELGVHERRPGSRDITDALPVLDVLARAATGLACKPVGDCGGGPAGRLEDLLDAGHRSSLPSSDDGRLANIICVAKIPSGDGLNLFAYASCMAKKKSGEKKPPLYPELAQRIREARARSGKSMSAVARELGLTRQGYAHYEYGNALPPASEIPKLCTALELPEGLFDTVAGIAEPSRPFARDLQMAQVQALWPHLDHEGRSLVVRSAEVAVRAAGRSVEDLYSREGVGG